MIRAHIEGAQETVAYYRDLAGNQLPFILALALTRTGQDCQGAVRARQEQVFILRHKAFIQAGVRIEPATKAKPQVVVKDIDLFMGLQEEGGTKVPYGKFLAVPLKGARPTARSLVSILPKDVMARGGFIRGNIMYMVTFKRQRAKRLAQSLGRNFMQGAEWDRGILPMYALVPKADVKARYGFVLTVTRKAQEVFPQRFGEAFQKTIGGRS